MGVVCTYASLATVDELFEFKAQGFELPPFPGYSTDQWGIKAHNRPWIANCGRWKPGQRVIEAGGSYSRLPEWLGKTFGVEPWVGDDFGESTGEELWSRWGDPHELPERYPSVTYRFENFGPGSSYKSEVFDCVFSVSTLEHIPRRQRVGALADMHRTLAPGGFELHTIDIQIPHLKKVVAAAMLERTPFRSRIIKRYRDGIAAWWEVLTHSGVDMSAVKMPSSIDLLNRSILVETPDVVYRLISPINAPKPYRPMASLLLVIEAR